MKFLFLGLLVSASLHAAEVAVIEDAENGTEIVYYFTDDSLHASLEKAWLQIPCKPRLNLLGSLKENYVLRGCRAELVKFLLNSGYKTIDLGRTFAK